MKKLITIAVASAVAFSLAGCAGAGLANDAVVANASYEAGQLIGKATTQDTLDLLSDGDIDTFCSDLATQTADVSTLDSFDEDQFTNGCVDGYNEANG
jgi:Flp pilus assembly protein TadD